MSIVRPRVVVFGLPLLVGVASFAQSGALPRTMSRRIFPVGVGARSRSPNGNDGFTIFAAMKFANTSFIQTSLNQRIVTRSPNHM